MRGWERMSASGAISATRSVRIFPLLLDSFPDAQGSPAARGGREFRGPFLAGSGEAELDRVTFQLVDPELGLPLGRALRHDVVDVLGLLGRVDRELGLEQHTIPDGDGRLAVPGDPLAGVEEVLRQRLPVG